MATILVVGNDRMENDTLALVLEFGGHLCETALYLQEAMKLLRERDFDLVLITSHLQWHNAKGIADTLGRDFPGLSVIILDEDGKPLAKRIRLNLYLSGEINNILLYLDQQEGEF
jgi:DNA-binding NtrC family response regulator